MTGATLLRQICWNRKHRSLLPTPSSETGVTLPKVGGVYYRKRNDVKEIGSYETA